MSDHVDRDGHNCTRNAFEIAPARPCSGLLHHMAHDVGDDVDGTPLDTLNVNAVLAQKSLRRAHDVALDTQSCARKTLFGIAPNNPVSSLVAHHRRNRPLLIVKETDYAISLHDRNQAVGGAEVKPDDAHDSSPFKRFSSCLSPSIARSAWSTSPSSRT